MTFFLEDARECIFSIRKVQTKACAKHEKSSKTPKNFLAGQKFLLDISKQKILRMKRLLKKVTTLKIHDSSEESCGDDSACSDSGGSESDCKN